MDLFTYLMAKKGHNTGGDLFSYLLGKNAGGGGTYTTFSGTSLNISNSIKAKIKNFMLNSTELTQDGTPTPDNPVDVNVITGSNNVKVENKNLFNKNNINDFYSYQTNVTINDDKSITITGDSNSGGHYAILRPFFQFKTGKTYTVSFEYEGDLGQMIMFKSSWETQGRRTTTNKLTFSLDENDTTLLGLGFYVDTNRTLKVYNIQIEEGSTATDYVEHQEQNYPITLSSKNLFNINGDVNTRYNGQTGNYNSVENNNLTTTYSTNNGYPYGQRIYVGTGKKVTISGIVTDINATGSKSALIMCFNDNTTTETQIVAFDDTEINTRKSFSFTPNTDYIIVAFAGRYTGFVSATFTDIQVEYGETATPYLPYIANPLEYCKIGDYADQFFKNTIDSEFNDNNLLENEWYLKKKVSKIDSYNGETITTPYISTTGGLDTGATVYYGLTTPTYIHISETDYPILRSQLENLYNNAKSYNGQTNITQTNEDLPFNISVDVKVANL